MSAKKNTNKKTTKTHAHARRVLYGETTHNPDTFKNGEKKEP